MATRRSQRKRTRKGGGIHSVLRLLYVLAAISAVFIAAVIFFRVEHVSISGNTVYESENILSATGIESGDNLFMLNKKAVARKLLTALPYLDEITITTALPDRVEISVTECIPLAYLEQDGVYYVLDVKGKVLAREEEVPELAPLSGVTALSPAVGYKLSVAEEERGSYTSLLRLLASIERRGFIGDVTSLDISSASDIVIGYDGRILIRFPYKTDFDPYTGFAQIILERETLRYDRGTLDMTKYSVDTEKQNNTVYFQTENSG